MKILPAVLGALLPVCALLGQEAVSSDGVPRFEFAQMKVLRQPPAPPYPPLAKIARIQGTVVVELTIGLDGIPETAAALEGPPQLRKTAEDYVRQWTFEPATMEGAPVRARFRLLIPFRLGDTFKLPDVHEVVWTLRSAGEGGPDLKELGQEVDRDLAALGVPTVAPSQGHEDSTHHLDILVKVSRDPEGRRQCSLTLRCSLLGDRGVAGNEPGKPQRVWTVEKSLPLEGSAPAGPAAALLLQRALEVLIPTRPN